MFGVCIRYDGNENSYDQWQGLLLATGCSELYVRGAQEECWQYKIKPQAVDNAGNLPAEREIVVVSSREARKYPGEIDLRDFEHPHDAIYFFGCDDAVPNCTGINNVLSPLDDLVTRKPEHKVFIDLHQEVYSFMAGAMVLQDRMVKMNGSYGQ